MRALYSISKSIVSRRRAADSAVARQGEGNNDTVDLEMELDGNSLDWRCINVRRTMIMIEESLRLACKAYIFEPNVANTWVTMKSMVRNFLHGIWQRGGFAGSRPDDAFSVLIGLHETMTAEDVLEGLLKVTVLVALTRPAEFIEITFHQQQQKS